MRSIIRLAAAGALALPIFIGAAGIASADAEYDHGDVSATSDGATVHEIASGVDENGDSYFVEQYLGAGPDGAGSLLQAAWTDDGDAGFYEEWTFSGPHGAYAGDTSAYAEAHDWYDGDDHHDDDYDDDDYDDDYDDHYDD